MSETTFWFGAPGAEGVWYIKTGTGDFTPIDISLLPGPQPTFNAPPKMVTVKEVGTEWSNEVIYSNRVSLNTDAGTTTVDALKTWNVVKNVQIKSDGGQSLYLDGFVHVDAQLGYGTNEATYLFLNGTKRANIITGEAGDTIEIRTASDQNSVWQDDYHINTGGGEDFIRFAPLDVDAELIAGDLTFTESVNKPGLPLLTSAAGRNAFIDMGANDDIFIGSDENDHVIAGTDDGKVSAEYETSGPSGYAYAIGGAPKDCWDDYGHGGGFWGKLKAWVGSWLGDKYKAGDASFLYKIDLATGEATVVGPVAIDGSKGVKYHVDVESLSINPEDGFLYGFATTTGKYKGLIKVDPATGETTYIGGKIATYKSELQDSTFDADGHLFIASQGDLLKVDVSTGNYTKVGDDFLSKKIGALSINPEDGKMYGLWQDGNKTYIALIDQNAGKVLATIKISGLENCSQIEGMAFDSDGTLWVEERVSGKIYTVDLVTKSATYVSKTLGVKDMTGDAFEAIAIDTTTTKSLVDLHADGGDQITTGAGTDHLFYAAGDGVDQVFDFLKADDTLHIDGYTAADIQIDVFDGDTFIRFVDGSADGFVDNAMIQLHDVTDFTVADISFISASDFFNA